MIAAENERPTRAYVQTCEDVDELLDIRADALEIVAKIDLELAADKTLPTQDARWAARAQTARRYEMRVARWASARLIEIAPEELGAEQPVTPAPEPPAPDQSATIERLTREAEALQTRVAEQARQLEALQPAARAAKEARRLAGVADAVRFERVFLDQARALLPAETFATLLREAMARTAGPQPMAEAAE